MCNSLGFKDDEARATKKKSTIDYSKIALKCIPSKIGRKGDPRMHKALEARLNNPKLSLFDALKIGGFEFHWEDDVSYDADHVLLSQRKNQLSRRIRLFKQSHEKNKMAGADCQTAPSVVRTEVSSKRKTDNDALESKKKSRNPAAGKETKRKNKMKRPSISSGPTPLAAQSSSPNFDGLNHESSGTFSHVSTGSLSSISGTSDSALDNAPQASFNAQAYPASAPVSANGNSAAQFASYAANVLPGSNALDLSHKKLTPSVITSTSSLPSNTTRAEKINQAMTLFSRDSTALMQKCLLSAGFSADEAASREMYIEFGEKALENERIQLEKVRMASSMNQVSTQSHVPSNSTQIPQFARQTSNNALPSNTQNHFGIRELTLMQQQQQQHQHLQQPNNEASLLPQQNLSNMYLNQSNQQVNNYLTASMVSSRTFYKCVCFSCNKFLKSLFPPSSYFSCNSINKI